MRQPLYPGMQEGVGWIVIISQDVALVGAGVELIEDVVPIDRVVGLSNDVVFTSDWVWLR